MQFFIKDANSDPNVPYAGKLVPRDAVAYVPPVQDPNVNYGGATLPAQRVQYVPVPKDLTNNPSLIVVGGITLPPDCAIYLDGEKDLVMSNILDGVSVFERILRKPYQIEFEMVVRKKLPNGDYIFPQEDFYAIWSKVWLPDSVQVIQNTFLNKLGIQQVIVQNISPTTVRGSTNLPLRLKCWENVPGQSLIIG